MRLIIFMKAYDEIAESWSKLRRRPEGFVNNFIKSINGSLLVAGCGAGRHSLLASNYGLRVVGVDSSINMIKQALLVDEDSDYLVGDVRMLPFKDKSFDYAISVAVLHHLRPNELLTALKELNRVVINDLLISVWLHPSLRGEQLIKWGNTKRYYYLYDEDEFINKVSKVFNNIKRVKSDNNIVLIVN